MPLIRCPKCGQAYDVPGVVAVRLPSSIATCHCGEWLAGSKAAVLARMLNPEEIKQIDLQPYRVAANDVAAPHAPQAQTLAPPSKPRSVRVIARGAKGSVNAIFTIGAHPLWIGRKGCHIDLEASDLDLRHCSIGVHGEQLVVRDANSHMGTFLDGQRVRESVIEDGVHLLRAGAALVSIEPTDEPGRPVEPLELNTNEFLADPAAIEAIRAAEAERQAQKKRMMLVVIDGPLLGQEFEIPPTGLVVGREGHVRVDDEFLSRRHFEVLVDTEGAVRIRDLGSRNGTFLNSMPAHNTKVHSGDEIRAGVHRFRIEDRV